MMFCLLVDSDERFELSALPCVSQVPSARWNLDDMSTFENAFNVSPLNAQVHERVRHAAFMWGIELLDHRRFAVSLAEAGAMDPQQRLLLEHAYASSHTAGTRRQDHNDSLTGIFLGITVRMRH